MSSTDGGSVASGNESGVSFWDKAGELFLTGANKYIDLEIAKDSRNIPDQNDLNYKTNRNSAGLGIDPKMLLIGGAFLLIALVVIKKVA